MLRVRGISLTTRRAAAAPRPPSLLPRRLFLLRFIRPLTGLWLFDAYNLFNRSVMTVKHPLYYINALVNVMVLTFAIDVRYDVPIYYGYGLLKLS